MKEKVANLLKRLVFYIKKIVTSDVVVINNKVEITININKTNHKD